MRVLHEGCGLTRWSVKVKESVNRPKWAFWKRDVTVDSYDCISPGCWTKDKVTASRNRNLPANQYTVVTFKGGIQDGKCCEKE